MRKSYVARAEHNYRAKQAFINVRIPRDMKKLLEKASGGNKSAYFYRLFLKDLKERGFIDV